MARNPREPLQKYVSLHLTTLRHKKVEITGEDLKGMGVEPGPRYADILRRVLAAAIDGQASCRSEQLALAQRLASGRLIEEIAKKEEGASNRGA